MVLTIGSFGLIFFLDINFLEKMDLYCFKIKDSDIYYQVPLAVFQDIFS